MGVVTITILLYQPFHHQIITIFRIPKVGNHFDRLRKQTHLTGKKTVLSESRKAIRTKFAFPLFFIKNTKIISITVLMAYEFAKKSEL